MASFQQVVQTVSSPNGVNSGWGVAVVVIGSMLMANTAVSPYVFGVLGVAMIVQLNDLLSGKTKTLQMTTPSSLPPGVVLT